MKYGTENLGEILYDYYSVEMNKVSDTLSYTLDDSLRLLHDYNGSLTSDQELKAYITNIKRVLKNIINNLTQYMDSVIMGAYQERKALTTNKQKQETKC